MPFYAHRSLVESSALGGFLSPNHWPNFVPLIFFCRPAVANYLSTISDKLCLTIPGSWSQQSSFCRKAEQKFARKIPADGIFSDSLIDFDFSKFAVCALAKVGHLFFKFDLLCWFSLPSRILAENSDHTVAAASSDVSVGQHGHRPHTLALQLNHLLALAARAPNSYRRVFTSSDKPTLVSKNSNSEINSGQLATRVKIVSLPINVVAVSVKHTKTASTGVPKSDSGIVGTGQKFIS